MTVELTKLTVLYPCTFWFTHIRQCISLAGLVLKFHQSVLICNRFKQHPPQWFVGQKDCWIFSQFLQIVKYNLAQYYLLQWTLDITKGQGTGKFAIDNEVSLYRGSFPYILLLLGWRKSFVIPRTSLYRGSLYRGSTVLESTGCLSCAFYRQDGGFILTGWWCISTLKSCGSSAKHCRYVWKTAHAPLCYLQAPIILNSLPASVKIRCTFDKPSWQFHQTM